MRSPGIEAAPGAADSIKVAKSRDRTSQQSQKNFHVEGWSVTNLFYFLFFPN